MRKAWLISALVAAVVGVGTVAAGFWLKSEVLAEVERTFAAMRAGGASATYGGSSFDLWSRELRLTDVAIAVTGDQPMQAKTASLVASGMSPWSGDISAQQLEVEGIDIKTSLGAVLAATYKSPRIVVQDFRLRRMPPVDPQVGTKALGSALLLSMIDAGSISIPTTMVTVVMPIPAATLAPRGTPAAPTNYSVDYTYANTRLKGVSDGRIALINVDSVGISSAAGGSNVRGAMKDIKASDIDVLPLLGVGLDRRQAVDGYYPVQGNFVTGAYTISLPDGGSFEIAGISGGGMGIDPAKFSHRKLFDIMADLAPGMPRAKLAAATIELVNFYEGFSLAGFEVRGFRIRVPGSPKGLDVGLDRMVMGQFKNGKLDEFRFEKFATSVPNGQGGQSPVKIDLLSLRRLDLAGLMRTSGRLLTTLPGQPPAQDPMAFLTMLEGIEVQGLSMPDPKTRMPLQIDAMTLTWGQFINNIPTSIQLVSKFKTPVDPVDPNLRILRDNGLRFIEATSSFGTAFDARKETFRLAPVEMNFEGLGALSAEVTLGRVTPIAFSTTPGQFVAAAQQFELAGLQLRLNDAGALAIALRSAGGGRAQDLVVQDIVNGLRQALQDPSRPGANEATLQTLARFLNAPGQTLVLQSRPKSPISLTQVNSLLAQPGGGLNAVIEQLNIEVQVMP